MSKRMLAALFAVQLICLPQAFAGIGDFDLPVVMDAGQTVPPIDLPMALGRGSVSFDASTEILSWTIEYEDLTGPLTVAHIHSGAEGETGGVLVDLLGNSTNVNGVMMGSLEIEFSTASQITTGDTYVNLHTAANGGGEIRGQVQRRSDFFLESGLDPMQATNAPGGMLDDARGTGTLTYDADADELEWNVEFSGLTTDVTVAHIHGPAAVGSTGGVLVAIDVNGTLSPLMGSFMEPNGLLLAYLLSGRTYFNIHTMMNGGGEIRGQILNIVFDDGFEGEGLDVIL